MLLSNFNRRKRDFGLMMAAGFSVSSIRKILFAEQALILLAGTLTGFVSALVATRPSLVQNSDVPWITILIMVLLIIITGLAALAVSVRSIRRDTLIARIRRE
jgi:ABC-type antimicrobial peptide transport system permease subunit